MIYYMTYLMYLWRLHRAIMMFHGMYVSYNMIVWIISGTKKTCIWILSWIPKPYLQLNDKQYIETSINNEYTLITRT